MRKTVLGTLLACTALSSWACDYQYPVPESYNALYRQDANGQPHGVLVDFANHLSRLSSCRLRPLVVPMARRNAMFDQDRLYLQLGVQEGMPSLQWDAEFVPLLRIQVYLLTTYKGLTSAEQVLSMPDSRIGMVNGIHLPLAFQNKLHGYQALRRIEYSNSLDSLLQKLMQARVQAVFDGISWTGREGIPDGQRFQRLAFSPPLFINVGSYLSHRMPKADRDRLSASLRKMSKDADVLASIRKGLRAPSGDIVAVVD